MSFLQESISNDDFLIREIIATHDPDDRFRLDSELLLSIVQSTLCYTTQNVSTFGPNLDGNETCNIDLSRIVFKISNEIKWQCYVDENLHTKTVALLEILGHYRWEAKVVLALASFVHSFALFWLVFQLQSHDNALAVSLAIFKQLPRVITMLKPKFKALNLLVNTMLKLTRVVIRFEGISLQHELVDDRTMSVMKSGVYMATYWICRSILVCSSHLADLRDLSLEQVFSDTTVVAAWGLYSLENKLNRLCFDLGQNVKKCQHQIETRLYENLRNVFNEKKSDNQKALRALFATQNEFPFKNSYSRNKIGIFELKSKIVLLLISKPDLLPLDMAVFLVHQARTDGSYAIVWVPIPSTNEWSLVDQTSFEFFSTRLPWFSIRKPCSLNSSVVRFFKQEWGFKEDPIMVVLNDEGLVANANAMDMVWIWGPKAFPFTSSREKELWGESKWTIDLIINGISPSLSQCVQEGKNLCIYGSENIHWIKEFNEMIKKMRSNACIDHLEVVYVGCKNPSENVKNIINTIDQENLSTCLPLNTMNFLWFRLERIKRSVGAYIGGTDVAELLDLGTHEGWALIGGGGSCNDVIKLDEERIKRCLDLVPLWRGNVAKRGLVGAIRGAFEASDGGGKCQHDEVVPFEEGLIEETLVCGSCKRPIHKFVLYKCGE